MKILLVDDEKLAIMRLQRMLNELEHSHIVAAESTQEAIELLKKEEFDTIFLDINMPQTSGLELAYQIRSLYPSMPIIFQTAYEEHALRAFDIGAFGYLVKPFSLEQLKNILLHVSRFTKEEELKIMSKQGDAYLLLKPEQIYYVQADLSEVIIRSDEGFSYYSQKISQMQELLQKHNFLRVHRSYLINTDKIKTMSMAEQSKLCFSFDGIKDKIESSKSGAKKFREIFKSPIALG
jgi:two-component system LytT family response regulator